MNIDPHDWQHTLEGKLISLTRCCRPAIPKMPASPLASRITGQAVSANGGISVA